MQERPHHVDIVRSNLVSIFLFKSFTAAKVCCLSVHYHFCLQNAKIKVKIKVVYWDNLRFQKIISTKKIVKRGLNSRDTGVYILHFNPPPPPLTPGRGKNMAESAVGERKWTFFNTVCQKTRTKWSKICLFLHSCKYM